MPEGHTVHRTADQFNRLFANRALEVESPQGRFSSGAKLVTGRQMTQARAIGKQMFIEFENELTIRIHLGIYGKWSYSTRHGDDLPEGTGQVRVRFYNQESVADLRGPTVCEVITGVEVRAVEARLGPDPLNPDPKNLEFERFATKVKNSRTPIGLQLMNQDVISGIGNVYRAEILFRAGIDPHSPGSSLTVEQIREIWDDSVGLLKVGVKTGFMITRDELFLKNPTKDQRNFIYKREGLPCRVCDVNVAIEMMAGRKLYWCPGCQK